MSAREKNSIFTRRGYALPAVLLFLAVSFGMWAVLYRTSGSMIRVEQARVLRASRTEWSAPAVATGLRLLQTGVPEGEFYECKLPITRDEVTKWFVLRFEKVSANRWSVRCASCEADADYPECPDTF